MLKYDHDLDITRDTSSTRILRRIRPGSTVLEFGPATGYMTRYMKEQLGCRVSCVELDPESAAVAAEFAELMVVCDLDDPRWIDELGDRSFDHVVFADVLEHLNNPWGVLEAAARFLAPHGRLLTSIPHVGHNSVVAELLNGHFTYRTIGLMDNTHIRFFTREGVQQLISSAGLDATAWVDISCAPQDSEFRTPLEGQLPPAVVEFLEARPDGEVYQFITESRHPRREPPRYPFRVSIIIPTFNKVEFTRACLEAIAEDTPEDMFEVVIVDNASTDGTRSLLAALEGDVRVILNEENVGFSTACNQGAKAAQGEYLLFLNNDTVPQPGWLEPLVAALDHDERTGMAGSLLLFPDGTIQHAGVHIFDVPEEGALDQRQLMPQHVYYRQAGNSIQSSIPRDDISAVTAACCLVRREAFFPFGGFDEQYWNGYEDIELCLRMRQEGWRIAYEPASRLIHHESASGPERFSKTDANIALLNERWMGRLVPDHVLSAGGHITSNEHDGVEFLRDASGDGQGS